jgi:hypothetical protein
MKRISAPLIVLVASSAVAGPRPTRWELYLAFPSPENAARVSEIAYSPGAIPEGYGYDDEDLAILQSQVLAGDREAFRLTYRLTRNASGALLEDLYDILAQSIRPQTTLFLREMAALAPPDSTLSDILLKPGLQYTDRPAAQRYEIDMRRKAIDGLHDPGIHSIRAKCLALMAEN